MRPVHRLRRLAAGRRGPRRNGSDGAGGRQTRRPTRGRRLLGVTGRSLIALGLLLLLFVGYQLWGTGVRTAQAQARLEDDLRAALADAAQRPNGAGAASDARGEGTPPTVPLPPGELPAAGEAAGRIQVAAIGLDWVFVHGVSVADLKLGPGHYPQTPMPGEAGNAAIAGHRTTYGGPFNRIDELEPGDEILVTTARGRFRYLVAERLIVDPSAVEVLEPVDGSNLLTLTSCHPKYSARQRIIVRAALVGEPLPAPGEAGGEERPEQVAATDDLTLSSAAVDRGPALAWGAAVVAIWAGIVVAARRWRRWPACFVGAAPLAWALFLFFEQVALLVPADY